MPIYTNNQFFGKWDVPTSAVVVANSPADAAKMLNEELVRRGLEPTALEKYMEVFPADSGESLRILSDFEY